MCFDIPSRDNISTIKIKKGIEDMRTNHVYLWEKMNYSSEN